MGLFEKYKNPNSNIGFGMNIFFGKKSTKLQQPVRSPSLADKTKDLTISGTSSKRRGFDGVHGSGSSKSKTLSSGLIKGELNDREAVSEGSVYGGYVPITIRLLQCLTRDSFVESGSAGGKYMGKSSTGASNFDTGFGAGEFSVARAANGGVSGGWRGWEDVLDNVAGANVDISQASSPHSTDQQPAILQGKKIFL
ncbi:hypothetical protein AYI69_g2336 [Smittium culicis]|uniref:Uncharacterized protein n=1 Tax=Smittium culicis TaxID=133412 RepID=A0A1R1YMU6_9FUNG|nr:hypothetical protein AYI69_g2336 [Smittium culicis]